MIARDDYLQKLLNARNPELVKILTGVRRCGKSTLLKLLKAELIARGLPEESCLEVDFEYASSLPLQDPLAFYKYVKSHILKKGSVVLFVDEVQELEQWAKIINAIRAEFSIDIYLTGSNGRMFSGEYLTYLSGRYLQIEIFPLSFSEYLRFKGIDQLSDTRDSARLYDTYATYGSLPAVALASSEELAQSLLDGLYDSVFARDIMLRGKIRNEAAFLRVMKFVLENIGNQTSAYSIATTLRSQGHPITADSVDNYLMLMCRAYLLYQCERYDIRGKERLKTNGKYYVVDSGLRNRALGYPGGNRGYLTENIAYMELLRRGFNVTVGTLPQAEIDFVARRGKQQYYIQVSESALDPKTLEREVMPFKRLTDGYPRILVTKDYEDLTTNGIRHINYYDFLLGAAL